MKYWIIALVIAILPIQLQANTTCYETGEFMSLDPIGIWEDGAQRGNGYGAFAGDPWNNRDPYGLIVETGWDLVSLAESVGRLAKNAAESVYETGRVTYNYYTGDKKAMMEAYGELQNDVSELGDAAIDTGVDVGAALIPGVPGGLSKLRYLDEAAEACRKLPFKDSERLKEVNKTLDRIESKGPFPHKKDGSIFKNREGKLPEGKYREYTVDTPGAKNRGKRRVVQDEKGNTFYTDDHYKNFVKIDPTKKK